MNKNPDIEIQNYFVNLQKNIVNILEKIEGKEFLSDSWTHNQGGGGLSRVIEGGNIFERAAVLFSSVTGEKLPPSASNKRPDVNGMPWNAMGVSLVIHPRNPYVPTTHMNVRLIRTFNQKGNNVFWFGGGMDLTPYYVFEDDAKHFHKICFDSLKPFGNDYYQKYKTWCDNYFFIKHRNEHRGIGGIFFDDLSEPNFDSSFLVTQSVGNSFTEAYIPIVEKRCNVKYGELEKEFQLYRRSRYVEFNLIYDRGTSFGLQSGGRSESILLSMPPEVKWKFNYKPSENSPESLLSQYLQPRDWL
ncbi:coproporphyrinogen III oxidase CPOX [Candidatus Kinetoplastibacterium desouzaii TCC079E]|uniref:coproporphyrinogen oxidase n=1 Tax=Candidatus Kinetoplastidibacterium desouzai TCC079E TaxID=1208919 RepID=M1L1Y5_9PROT|nr:oxygen-dependent coproporphyrinogen oxidase [Candidatus Kinetoplastibacterium desouzaii]AGF46758.1 coproporphyrinogen III oxidase CPOX [Candidatus Kinetoplastibacterium desouzaii TCC079E]